MQNYYDNYISLRSAVGSNSNYPDDTSGNSRGFLTGTMTKVLGTDTKLYTAFYYDIEGKVTKKVQQNMLGGHDITTTTYSFSGKPLTVIHAHTATNKTARTEVYTYTYDEKDRVSMVKHKLGSAEVILASYTYDKFGRMATRRLHGSGTNQLNYSYNIQSWLTGISSTKFSQTLTYNNGTTGFNGNISSMNWNANGASHSYTFTYDGANRMLNATHGTGAYTEKVTSYDKNGNIKALQRYGNGLIDNLTYTYSGNQLTKVEDATGNTAGFSNGANAANEYTYDNNGNLTKDSNKNISTIAYNCLNLPSKVTFTDGSTIVYSYAADGTKLRTVHTISGTTTQKDYCSNVVYENGVQKLLLTEEGYVNLSDGKYYYYLKDHQGNNRVVVKEDGTVSETNHYYPFGGVFASTGNVQPYKYNGKELDTKKGLNWYDYGARHYDAMLGRWFTVDPKAEDLMKWSLYSYCYDNPIKFVDPDGMQGRPAQRPIRRNLRNGGSSIGIYEFFNLPKPQSTRTVTTYKYRGGMLREKMALGEQNYVKNVTVGDNTVQMTNNNNVGMRLTGRLGLLNNAKEFSKQLLNMSTETIYHDNGRVYKNTVYIIQDPVLAEMQREYTELYNYHSEQLGDELSLLEKHGIIQSKIGISPLWTIIMDMLMNPDNYEADTQLQVIPEFRQGK